MTSVPQWTRETLKNFTDAATEAVANTISDFQKEARRERELRDAQFAARTAQLDYRLASVADLERRLTERLATLKDGRDGTVLTLDDVRPAIADYVDHVLRGWERPKDGTSITVEDVEPVLRQLVSEAVAKIPRPKAARVSVDDFKPLIAEQVAAAVARLQQDQHVSPARHWPPRWPHDRPIIDIETAPHTLTDKVTEAVKMLAAPAPQEARP